MLREDGLRQKAELLVSLARIDERRTEGDADELARADAEERGRCFTNERKLVGKKVSRRRSRSQSVKQPERKMASGAESSVLSCV